MKTLRIFSNSIAQNLNFTRKKHILFAKILQKLNIETKKEKLHMYYGEENQRSKYGKFHCLFYTFPFHLGVWRMKKVMTVKTRIMASLQSFLCWCALLCLLSDWPWVTLLLSNVYNVYYITWKYILEDAFEWCHRASLIYHKYILARS